ncbi:MAG: hypothetical protein HUU46_05120 [Candidatus Hydrogenedentes bacterium]|nr:hypothetical protein [Candidatus Hydrogenedentota bacterium]
MIEVKEAVKIASAYLHELLDSDGIADIMLEEVELSEDEQEWHVTLGFHPRWSDKGPFDTFTGKRIRIYKTFTVDRKNGKISAMKIRQLQ